MSRNKYLFALLILAVLSSCATKYVVLRSDMETSVVQIKKKKYDSKTDSTFNIRMSEKEYQSAVAKHYVKLTDKQVKWLSKSLYLYR